jgi:hypothetical protein
MIIETPSENLPFVIDIKGMMISAEHILGFASMYLLNPQCLLVLISCLQHSANLATLGISPAIDFAVCG